MLLESLFQCDSSWFGGLKNQGNEPHFRNQRELKEWSAKPKSVTFPWTYLDDRGVQKPMSHLCVPAKHTLALALRHQKPHCVFVSGFWWQVQWQHGLRKRAPWLGNSVLHYQVLQISWISPVIYAPSKPKYTLPKWVIFSNRNLKSRSRKDL